MIDMIDRYDRSIDRSRYHDGDDDDEDQEEDKDPISHGLVSVLSPPLFRARGVC